MSISILSNNDTPTDDLNTLEPSFMYSKLLNQILVEIEHDKQAKTNLVEFCGIQYQDNRKELRNIEEFHRNYSPSTAIE